jgi:uncharacterized membrane protein YecN with MAPEG domain
MARRLRRRAYNRFHVRCKRRAVSNALSFETGEKTMLLPTTLCIAAAAVIVNIWLSIRCGKIRATEKIGFGDGGNEAMIRRMRAQSNFIEQVPVTLILIAAVEMAGKGGVWLAPVGGIFILGRVCHALGMDANGPKWGRAAGMLTSMLSQIGLAIVAVLSALGTI